MIIDGKAIASEIQNELQNVISLLKGRKPCLAMVLVGEHLPSKIYVSRKAQACGIVGMRSVQKNYPESISEADLISALNTLNADENIDGILLQLPLPRHINPMKVLHCISPEKDVDGLHPMNAGKLLQGDPSGFVPCTPLGIQTLLMRSNIKTAGKHVVVMGRSNLVGKPIAALLMQNTTDGNATVTVIHSHTRNIPALTRTGDILIAAIGKPKFVTADMVREGAVIIDVGINKIDDASRPQGYQIVGDVDFEAVQTKCSAITPVPGGIGPMTIAMLLSNTWKSFKRSEKI